MRKGAVECYRACYRSIDDLGKLVKKIRSDSEFRKKQSLYFAALKKDIGWLRKECEARKEHDLTVKWLEADEIEKRYRLKNTFGGILSEQCDSVDAFQLAHDILAFNYRKGLRIFDKTDIKTVDHKRNGITAVTEHGSTIKAKTIIYCNGFESTEIIKEKFVNLLSTYAIVAERYEDGQTYLLARYFRFNR